MDAKSSSTSIPPHGPTIHLKATDVSSTKSQAENEGSPIDAHLTQTKPSSPTELSSSSAELPSVRTAPPAISDSKLPTVAQNRSPSVLQISDSESSIPSSSSLVPNLSVRMSDMNAVTVCLEQATSWQIVEMSGHL